MTKSLIIWESDLNALRLLNRAFVSGATSVGWNPWNHLVQDHRDGSILWKLTEAARIHMGLSPERPEYESMVEMQWTDVPVTPSKDQATTVNGGSIGGIAPSLDPNFSLPAQVVDPVQNPVFADGVQPLELTENPEFMESSGTGLAEYIERLTTELTPGFDADEI